MKGRWKSVIFDALVVLAALTFGYLYRRYIHFETDYLAPFLSLTVFLVLTLLGTFFGKEIGRRFFVLVFETAALLVFFFDQYPLSILATIFATVILFLFWGEALGRQELANSLQVKFFKVATITLRKAMTGIIFLIVVLYLPRFEAQKTFIPRPMFQGFFTTIASITKHFYKEIDLDAPVGDIARNLTKLRAENDLQFKNFSPEQQEELVNQGAKKFIDAFSKNLEINLTGRELLSDILYNFLSDLGGKWRETSGSLLGAFVLIILFITLRSASVIYYLLIATIAWLGYQLLLAFNYIHLESESFSKEVIEYS